MKDPLERLLNDYDRGRLSRRGLLGALAALLAVRGESEGQESSPAVPVRSLNHVTLNVSDVERSTAFYQRLFGMPVLSRQENGVNLSTGTGFVGLYSIESEAEPGIHHFCLGFERFDVDSVLGSLAEEGVTGRVRMRGDIAELYLRDPDGITVQLQDLSYRG